MKIGQRDKRGRIWTASRQTALMKAHSVRHPSSSRPASASIVAVRRGKEADTTMLLLVRGLKRLVQAEVRGALKRLVRL